MSALPKQTAIQALAESWASIDGKTPIYGNEPDRMTYPNGDLVTSSRMEDYCDGYEIESKEMIVRLKKRGYAIVPIVVIDELQKLEVLNAARSGKLR